MKQSIGFVILSTEFSKLERYTYKMGKHIIITILLLFVLGWPDQSYSQESFSEIKFTLTGSQVLGGNTLLKSWSPTNGIGLELAIPYYFGNLETGIRYMRFDEFEFEDSGFHSSFIFVGWNYTYYVSEENTLSIVPAVRLGSRYMVFDEEKIYRDEYRFSRFESEFAYEFQFRIQYRINKNLEFYTSAAYNRTLFYIPYAEWSGVAGFSIIFDTSGGLENFLR